jgi:HEAT repeat protein
MKRALSITLAASFFLSPGLSSRNADAFGDTPIIDGEQVLQEKYQPLTKDALLAALHDGDPDVRGLAASMLAARRYQDALPLIWAAFAKETVLGNRVTLALAAARLGSKQAISALKAECGNTHDPEDIRMMAATAAVYVGNEDCLDSVLVVLRARDDRAAVLEALSLLPHFTRAPSEKMQEIRQISGALLTSEDFATRTAAIEVLGKLGDGSSILDLEGALSEEQDDGTRRAIAAAIKLLESK